MKTAILFFLVLFPVATGASDLKGSITVKIDSIRSDRGGDIRVALFKSEEGFPVTSEKAYKKEKNKIANGKSEFVFTNVPYGEYAISVHHDENLNGEMDTNFLGIPKEGQGSSNNVKTLIGPPKYKDAMFILNSENIIINVKVNY